MIYALQRGGRILLADDMGLGKTLQGMFFHLSTSYHKMYILFLKTFKH